VYGEIDIALDTFPYNGTTTTCEALWMGVPVVTLTGERHAGRVGASILSRVGLSDLVAVSPDAYLRATESLARDMGRLSLIRNTLRQTMISSSLCNGAGFAASIENAYRLFWQKWCVDCSNFPS
jgi:protein O-GlcNAc transferase